MTGDWGLVTGCRQGTQVPSLLGECTCSRRAPASLTNEPPAHQPGPGPLLMRGDVQSVMRTGVPRCSDAGDRAKAASCGSEHAPRALLHVALHRRAAGSGEGGREETCAMLHWSLFLTRVL